MVTPCYGQGIDGIEEEDGWVLGRYVQGLMSDILDLKRVGRPIEWKEEALLWWIRREV